MKKIKPRYIINEKGERKSVVLSYKEYQNLMEDIEDLAKVAERREEFTISHNELIQQLKNDVKDELLFASANGINQSQKESGL